MKKPYSSFKNTLYNLHIDLPQFRILMTDLIGNHDQVVAFVFYSGSLTYSFKRDWNQPPVFFVVIYVVVFDLFIYLDLMSFNIGACHFYCLDIFLLSFLLFWCFFVVAYVFTACHFYCFWWRLFTLSIQ